jgi:hypothetical protein
MCGIAGIMTHHGDAAPGRLLRAMGAAWRIATSGGAPRLRAPSGW